MTQMNQIFKIAIGPETVNGKLQSLRVGQGFSSRFHITGVSPNATAPKVWVSIEENAYYWTAVWDPLDGVWVVDVGSTVTVDTGTFDYAVTMGSDELESPHYIAGQGKFVVYPNIAITGGLEGDQGSSVVAQLNDHEIRITALEAAGGGGGDLPAFDPATAYDHELRAQVDAITTYLNGV